jgi:alpha-glucosidase
VAPVHPLYYDWPADSAAYDFADEYGFGPDMIVRPITAPMSPDTLLAHQRLWLPPGDWYEWFTGTRLHGPAVVTRAFALDEIPVYVRAGAIVPMATKARRSDAQPKDLLALTVFPGDSGSTRVYQDAGDDLGYQRGRFAWTPVSQGRDAHGKVHLRIGPTTGKFEGLPARRGYVIQLVGSWPPRRVLWNGREIRYAGGEPGANAVAQRLAIATPTGDPDAEPVPRAPGWSYNGNSATIVIQVPKADIRTASTLEVELPVERNDSLLDGVPSTLSRLQRAIHILEGLWPAGWPPDSMVALQQTGNRITLKPGSAAVELKRLRAALPGVLERVGTLHGDSAGVRRALAHLGR